MKKITLLITLFVSVIGFSQELITNGNFETANAGEWYNNAANIVTENGNSYNSANVGTAGNPYDVNLSQKGLNLTQGKTYTLKFDAWSDRDRILVTGIGLSDAPYTNVTETINLTNTSQEFTLTLTANFTSNDSRVIFDMGNAVGFVGIDNVSLTETEEGTGSSNAETLLGFETAETGGLKDGPFGSLTSATITDGTGSNTSKVVEIVANQGGEIWQGQNFTLSENVDLTNTQTMSIDVKSSTAITFLVKVNGGIGGAVESAAAVTHNGDGTWQTLEFTFNTSLDNKGAPANGVYSAFVVHAYWAAGATQFSGATADARTFQIDNIKGPKATNVTINTPSDAPSVPSIDASNVISLYSDAYTNVASNKAPGWGENNAEESYASNNVMRSENFLPFALDASIDISSKDKLHVDVWLDPLPAAGAGLLIKLLATENGPNEGNFIYEKTNLVAGSWNSIDIPLSSFTQAQGTWNATAQANVNQVLVDIVDDTTIYIDNVYFYKEGPTASVNAVDIVGFKMYPNPANNSLNISAKETISSVEIFNILGSKVKSFTMNGLAKKLDINDLKSGVYMVRFTANGNVGTSKFIKK